MANRRNERHVARPDEHDRAPDRDEHWVDRSTRLAAAEDRDARDVERYGTGQSGYGAGRYESDRSYGSRHEAARIDERGGGYLAQSGQEMGYGDEEPPSSRRYVRRYEQPGELARDRGYGLAGHEFSHERMYGRNREDNIYGSWTGRPQGIYGRGPHRGKGPLGYTRSDERIRELVCDVLLDHDDIDASNIEVYVDSGEVTLTGTVDDRRTKRLAEDSIEHISGVNDVVNNLRISTRPGATRAGGPAVEMSGPEQAMQSSTGNDKRHRA